MDKNLHISLAEFFDVLSIICIYCSHFYTEIIITCKCRIVIDTLDQINKLVLLELIILVCIESLI